MRHADTYQHFFKEEMYSPIHMAKIAQAVWTLNPIVDIHVKDKIADLTKLLKLAYLDLIPQVCTPHQLTIINLLRQGYTQTEISKKLGKTQSCVNSAIFGKHNYIPGQAYKHGGALKKLQKAAKNSLLIKRLRQEIAQLNSEDWTDYIGEEEMRCQ